jgi:hypothetical protein
MKTKILLFLALGGVAARAATIVQTPGRISVEGIINGGLIAPGAVGDTLDYLKFEVLTTGDMTMTFTKSGRGQLWIGRYIGLTTEFAFLYDDLGKFVDPYSLIKPGETPTRLTLFLHPGIYVIAYGHWVGPEENEQVYDIDQGFLAVNPNGGGFTWGDYAYRVDGEARALEYWDGELDGSFIVTNLVPEPGLVVLLGVAAAFACFRRRTGSVSVASSMGPVLKL